MTNDAHDVLSGSSAVHLREINDSFRLVQKLTLGFFSTAVLAKSFNLCMITTSIDLRSQWHIFLVMFYPVNFKLCKDCGMYAREVICSLLDSAAKSLIHFGTFVGHR